MTTRNRSNEAGQMYDTVVKTVLVPLLFVAMTGMLTWINKMEDRIYDLQRESVTEQKLEATERRITSYLDVRLQDLDNKMQLVIRQLEIISARQQDSR